jgi:hypothetical protein
MSRDDSYMYLGTKKQEEYSREMLAFVSFSILSVYLHNSSLVVFSSKHSVMLATKCKCSTQCSNIVIAPLTLQYYVCKCLSLTLVTKNSNLSIIQMQKILLLTTNIKSKSLPNSALPRRTKLFVKRVLNESRRTFVIVRALELIDCHCCDVYDVISHLGRQVTVLNCWKSD